MSKKLGNLVKEARTAKGLTQAALADKVAGITASDVSKIERGEKEPTQEILKKMAKVLGVTQKSLLEAATGTGKTASSSKKKTATSKKTSSSKSSSSLTLTATEKKLVQLYRKADTSVKKAAINLLEGDANAIELIGALMSSKNADGSDSSSATSEILSSLLSGKTGGSSSSGSSGKETINALMEMLGKMNK